MLDLSPKKLREEVEAAVKFRERHTGVQDRFVRRYAGKHYRNDWAGDDSGDNLEGHEFEYQVNTVPGLVHQNPAVEVKNLIPGIDDEVKTALDAVYPVWIERANVAKVLKRIAWDLGFNYGVAMVGLDVVPGYEHLPPEEPKPLWPRIYRVSPRRFFIDPQADSFETARFMGHTWVQDKADLLSRKNPDGTPMYDTAAVNALVDDEIKEGNPQVNEQDTTVKRGQVMGYEVWCRENNMLYTIGASCNGGEERYLREPRQFAGCPVYGPYTMFGVYVVPDQIYPLPPLAATAELVEEINAHRGQASEDAGTAKRFVAVDGQNKQAFNQIQHAKSGSILRIPGLASGAAQQFEIGGPAQSNLDYIDRLEAVLDRRSGLTDTQRGEINGATATEVDEAAEKSDVRTRFMRTEFRDSVKVCFKQAGHFFIFSEAVSFIVPVQQQAVDPMTGEVSVQTMPMIYQGGMAEGQDPTAYNRLHIEIDPYSMEMVDQGLLQRRMGVVMELAVQAAPLMPQTPWMKWVDLFDDYGESMNIKNLGSRYIDAATLQGAQQAMVMQQAMGVAEQQAEAQGEGGGKRGAPRRKAAVA